MKNFNMIASVVGRILVVAIYLLSAVGNKIPNFNNVSQYMASEGIPMPSIMLVGAIVFLLVGGVSVLVGYKIRIGAAMLLIFLLMATYFFHDFWNFDGEARQQQMIQFMKNTSLMGTMLFFMANGPGTGSIEHLISADPRTGKSSKAE